MDAFTTHVPNAARADPSDRWLFHAFLGVLVWAPLPLASHRPWAWAILELWIFSLAGIWLCKYLLGRVNVPRAFRHAAPILITLGLWLVYGALQFIPWPHSLSLLLSPTAADAYEQAVRPDTIGRMFAHPLSVDGHASLVAWLKSLAYVLTFALALLLVRSYRRVRLLAYALVFSALFQALYGSLMTLSGLEYGFFVKKTSYLGHATGTFVNRNHLAAYLVMTLGVGIGLLIGSLRHGSYPGRTVRQTLRDAITFLLSAKMRLRIYLGVLVVALILTHSRMGNTAFFASLLIAGLVALILSRHATRKTVILLASLVVIDVALLGTWFGLDEVVERLQRTSLTAETRDEVNRDGLKLTADYRLIGTGGGTFQYAFPRYRGGDVPGYYDYAHNDYLQFVSEYGIVGTSLLGLALVLSLVSALRAQVQRRRPLMRGMAFAALMGITAMLLHGTVEFNLQIPANAVTFMVILALAWLSLYLKEERDSRAGRHDRPGTAQAHRRT